MSETTRRKPGKGSNKTNPTYSAIAKAHRRHEDPSERPYTIEFSNVINKGCLVRGLRNAGFDIDGAQSSSSFHGSKMDIVFVTRRHGRRVLEAFQGGLTMPGLSKKVTATSKCPATFDVNVDALGRDTKKPVPYVQQIRDSVSEAYSFLCAHQVTTEPAIAINNQQRGVEQTMKAVDDETGPVTKAAEAVAQGLPPTGRTDVAFWVEDGVRYYVSKEYVGKRKRNAEDETNEGHPDGKRPQGHKRLCGRD